MQRITASPCVAGRVTPSAPNISPPRAYRGCSSSAPVAFRRPRPHNRSAYRGRQVRTRFTVRSPPCVVLPLAKSGVRRSRSRSTTNGGSRVGHQPCGSRVLSRRKRRGAVHLFRIASRDSLELVAKLATPHPRRAADWPELQLDEVASDPAAASRASGRPLAGGS